MLSIPYIREPRSERYSVVSIRYRCLEQHEHSGHGKYNTETGDRPRLYNTVELLKPHTEIAITEGELDAIAATQAGVPAVGIPGVTSWREWFTPAFLGYDVVWILSDGDDPGRVMARNLLNTLPNARHITMPEGVDVNTLVIQGGPSALLERMK